MTPREIIELSEKWLECDNDEKLVLTPVEVLTLVEYVKLMTIKALESRQPAFNVTIN